MFIIILLDKLMCCMFSTLVQKEHKNAQTLWNKIMEFFISCSTSWLCNKHFQMQLEIFSPVLIIYIYILFTFLFFTYVLHPAQCTLFLLTLCVYSYCWNELGAHKYYFCFHCQSWYTTVIIHLVRPLNIRCYMYCIDHMFLPVQLWQ